MQYTLKAASGDAGEYFFAYQIAHVLKWPCRLLDIDIGIDAQVEVLGEDRMSSGRFVAVQVKARLDDGANYRYVSEAQLKYWLELDVPVFVVLVNLNDQAMYLHQISKTVTYHRTEESRVRIDFDKKNEIFSSKTAARLSSASIEAAMQHIRPLLEEVKIGAKKILDYLEGEVNNGDHLIDLMQTRFHLKKNLAQASALVHAMRVGEYEHNNAALKLEEALGKLAKIIDYWRIQQDRPEYYLEIKAFMDEQR